MHFGKMPTVSLHRSRRRLCTAANTTFAQLDGAPQEEDTIFAPCTGAGGAIAIIRMSGGNSLRSFELLTGKKCWTGCRTDTPPSAYFNVLNLKADSDCLRFCNSLYSSPPLADPTRPPPTNKHILSHKLTYTALRCPVSRDLLDRCLACYMPAPKTHTGEDSCEFHVHASFAVVKGLMGALGKLDGNRVAEPGEFTRRAFHNGKLDVTGVEALSALLQAETAAQRRLALADVGGGSRSKTRCNQWRDTCVQVAALIEAYIDFSEEDNLGDEVIQQAAKLTDGLVRSLDAACAASAAAERIRHGYRLTLAGHPNAGKSSLMNAICGRETAIVSPTAGTTRDVLRARLDLRGLPVDIADTAGLRALGDQTGDLIEAEGQRRALIETAQSDCALVVFDTVELLTNTPERSSVLAAIRNGVQAVDLNPDATSVVVLNKIDMVHDDLLHLLPAENFDVKSTNMMCLRTSCVTGHGLDRLSTLLGDIVQQACSPTSFSGGASIESAAAAAYTQRQRTLVAAAADHLRRAAQNFDRDAVIAAQHVRCAMHEFGKITGDVVEVEEVLDVLFSRFCIGK